jgi:hypothetical protein
VILHGLGDAKRVLGDEPRGELGARQVLPAVIWQPMDAAKPGSRLRRRSRARSARGQRRRSRRLGGRPAVRSQPQGLDR